MLLGLAVEGWVIPFIGPKGEEVPEPGFRETV